jgi:NitT/TauT family transport system ATP-binding protein
VVEDTAVDRGFALAKDGAQPAGASEPGGPDPGGGARPQPKIVARAVERRFGSGPGAVHALGPFDVEIAEGEFVCVVGPSGCGKSTFLRMVAGLVRPSAGEIEIHTTARPGPSPIAMVFQEYAVYPWKTVLANVRFGLDLAGVGRREANDKARHWLDRLGLADFAKAYPDTLSGGMRQRVSIARALAVEPEILLMDEPFAALDAQLRTILQDELLALWQADQRTVLFITHSLEEATLLGDRVVVMTARPGRTLVSKPVPFPRPRSAELRADPEFARFQAELWDGLRGEVEQHAVHRREEGA